MGRQVYGDEHFLELELSEHPYGLVAGDAGTQRSRTVVQHWRQEAGSLGREAGSRERWKETQTRRWGRGEMTLFFLSSSEQGLLCPQEPLGSLSLNHRADTQGEVACLGLGCDRKQEVPVISQEGLTVRERASENWQTPKVG